LAKERVTLRLNSEQMEILARIAQIEFKGVLDRQQLVKWIILHYMDEFKRKEAA
jgi:hypothetical protein